MTDLKCPKCKQIAQYGGYPANPQLSFVECLGCGYIGAGASFERVNQGDAPLNRNGIRDERLDDEIERAYDYE